MLTIKLIMSSFVQVNVGGIPYSIALSDIEKFPGSFFQCMVKKEWTDDSVNAISIQRDGALFKYVFAYIVNGHLPRNKSGLIDLDVATLDGVKEEADFFGLEELSKECNIQRRKGSELDIHSFVTIRKYITNFPRHKGNLQIDLYSRVARALKCVWSPFCVTGMIRHIYKYTCSRKLYGETSIRAIFTKELMAIAAQSPFGRGTETIIDTAVRNSFEIDASHLDSAALDGISKETQYAALAPHLNLTLRPYKLVIYKEGGHFNEHRDTVRGNGHIGTLVVILNSEYTGGELEVTHGGRTEVVTGPYSWVAMYGDCLHKINPVTSGTRVSLIYDIYAKGAAAVALISGVSDVTAANDIEDDEDGDEEDDERFWENQPKDHHNPSQVPDRQRDLSEAEVSHVLKAVIQDLKSFDTIIICLQHLYPECQTNPAFLKGGDRTLYDILTVRSTAFDVQVVAATIYRSEDEQCSDYNETVGALFSPAIVKRTLGLKTDSEDEEEEQGSTAAAAASLGLTKLVIPNNLDPDSLLDYTPYIDHTGNESQAEESVYIVAGLQVRRKV